MPGDADACRFQKLTELGDTKPTLIEGLPGLGMVAAIAVNQITNQLNLEHHGNIRSNRFPPVATFEDGRIVDTVRVYAGQDPAVLTLQSAMPIPPTAYDALSGCVLDQLEHEFQRAIFLVGIPAESEDELGQVLGIATADAQQAELENAGIELAEGLGLIGGPTGALIHGCHENDTPAITLLVKVHPQLPDPGSARALIENALEPLVSFDIDTSELKERDEDIQHQLEEVAKRYRQMQQQEQAGAAGDGEPPMSMYS